jgi:hypothetical protein
LYGAPNLKEVVIPETHPTMCIYNGCIYTKDCSELIYYPSQLAYDPSLLHENVSRFGDYSFVKHNSISEIVIPDNVSFIGK